MLLVLCCLSQPLPAQAPQAPGPADLVAWLQRQAAADPQQAATWRLLGRAQLRAGNPAAALAACRRAVELDPTSAAARHDLGMALLADQQPEAAAEHLRVSIDLAPESHYAASARAHLEQLVGQRLVPEVELASLEVEWLDVPRLPKVVAADELRRLYLRFESGVLFNNNVTLTPISRELSPDDTASAQAYVSPEFEYLWPLAGEWQGGTFLRTYFNFNEDRLEHFNLQHLRPGVFLERPVLLEHVDLLPRLTYDFTFDAFDGRTVGTRHAASGSLAAFEGPRTWLIYAAADYTDFRDDGAVPDVASLDGPSVSLGASVKRELGWRRLARVRAGIDGQWAPVEGSSFAYQGVMLSGAGEVPLPWQSLLVLGGAIGYRDYYRFEFEPSRNELVWRAAAELRRQFGTCWSASLLVQYDRFASDNELFDAQRMIAGGFVTFER